MRKTILYKPIFHILLIVILGLLAYSNTFDVFFQFDDKIFIINNQDIKDLRFFFEPSETNSFGGFGEARSIGFFTFALNYRFHGLDVAGYHIVNLLIHIINALLVYFFIVLSFKTPYLSKSTIKDYNRHIAVFTSLLFVCHPIQTQAVTYIWQRVTSLATMWYLLSLVAYVKFRIQKTGDRRQESGVRRRKLEVIPLYLISLISAILAMKTKEIAFTLPVIIVFYEFIFLSDPSDSLGRKGKIKRRFLYLTPILLTMLIIPLSFIGVDKPLGEMIGDVSGVTRETVTISRLDYLLTEFRVIMTYIRLIFLPVNQNLDYDYPVYHSLFNVEVFLSFLFLSAIFVSGVYLFYRYRSSATHTRLLVFSMFWFFVTLSVESSVIPISDVINEHRMYLPSVGILTAIIVSLFILAESLKQRWRRTGTVAVTLLSVVVLVLAGATYARNNVWKDEVILWEDVVSKSPKKARGHNNLGLAYKYRNLTEKAFEHYKIAATLDPDYADAHYNLGNTYQSLGLTGKAIEQYQITIKLNPSHLFAYNNLGNIYSSLGIMSMAIQHYQTALKLKPDFQEAYYNLGIVYETQGLLDKAIKTYKEAVRLKPDWIAPHFALGQIYYGKGDLKEAEREFQKILQIDPQNKTARLIYDLIIKR